MSPYEFIKSQTNAVDETIDALVQLNIWARRAKAAGWHIAFKVNDFDGLVGVTIARSGWTDPDAPQEREG